MPATGVSAVVLNVTVTQPSAQGHITVYPDGTTLPTASNLNFSPGETVPNLVIAPVGSDGKVDLNNGSSGTVELIADVSGYFSGGGTAADGAFTPVAPTRLLDTRNGTGAPQAPSWPGDGGAQRRRGWGRTGDRGLGRRAQRHGHTAERAGPHHRLPRRDDAAHRLEPELLSRRDRAQPGHRPGRC